MQRQRSDTRRKISLTAAFLLSSALILPCAALSKLSASLDPRLLFGYLTMISAVTFALYFRDKRRAAAGEWRISEATLHVAELLGGWPGAFLAQRLFRHKIVKGSYQFAFWLVILLHEYVALDYLKDWSVTRQLFSTLQRVLSR